MRKSTALSLAVLFLVSLFITAGPAFAAKRHKKTAHAAMQAGRHRHIEVVAPHSARNYTTAAANGKDPAKPVYQKALAGFDRLSRDKKRRRLRAQWGRVIGAFDSIVKKYPDSQFAGYAMFSMAEAYSAMYDVSRVKDDLDMAAVSYDGLAGKFPDNEHAAEALYKAAGIYMKNGDDKSAARDYKLIITNFSNSTYKDEAQKSLNKLPEEPPPPPAVGKAQPVDKGAVKDAERDKQPEVLTVRQTAGDTGRGGLAVVKGIRHWSNGGFSRVVIDLDGAVTCKGTRIKTPDRLFFDVKRASINSQLKDGVIDIHDGILKSVRASQYGPETVRVVLDLESIKSYRALMLKDPPRLVVDVTGKDAEALTAKPNCRNISVSKKDDDKKHAPVLTSTTTIPFKANQVAPPTPPEKLSLAQQLGLCVRSIVIDPGHGGKDTGAIGPDGLLEKDVVLDVGLRLKEIIKKDMSCKVVMTRDKDVFIDLDARPGIAVQQDADLFISIHANASKNPKATGIETYLLNLTKDRNIMQVAARENMTTVKEMGDLDVILKDLILDNKRDESQRLAHAVQGSLVDDLNKDNKSLKDKGVKQGPFLVLYGASMPSILTEIGFISNPKEEKLLADPDYRQRVAQAVYDGIKLYINNIKVASYSSAK